MQTNEIMLQCDFPSLTRLSSGKVREMFDLGDRVLMVATDRISAFNVIMSQGITDKGQILTIMSALWLNLLSRRAGIIADHLITCDPDEYPAVCRPYAEALRDRSMLVWKAEPLLVECVVRGYLAGSGWKEYRETGAVCGIRLPPGLKESAELPEPIFTPATKAETGHDLNITFAEMVTIVGERLAVTMRGASLALYKAAQLYARRAGIIIADTKFEFGLRNGQLILIDEVLTPDSSRFWPADQYAPGKSQPSFDKQCLRDYLETLDWNKQPPASDLPQEVIEQTARKYREALRSLTGVLTE